MLTLGIISGSPEYLKIYVSPGFDSTGSSGEDTFCCGSCYEIAPLNGIYIVRLVSGVGETSTWHRFRECPVCVCSKGRQAGTVRTVSSATTTLAQILHAILVTTILLPLYVQIPCAQQPVSEPSASLLCKSCEDSPGYTGPLVCSALASFSQALARCAF